MGRGTLAGPVLVGAVALEDGQKIEGVRDSKKLSESRRIDLVPYIDRECVDWMMTLSDVKAIDKYGIAKCTMVCMKWLAKIMLIKYPEATVIVDGNELIEGVPRNKQKAIVKADDSVHAVSAASVLAKVERDRRMVNLSTKWPRYGFHRHKGYGTKEHTDAIKKYGPCSIHRRSFNPVKSMLAK